MCWISLGDLGLSFYIASQEVVQSRGSLYATNDMSNYSSVTERYWMASTARCKLSKAAAESEHNLRLLVGHANLLDSKSASFDQSCLIE